MKRVAKPANVAQSVEHIHGKDGVASPILAIGSEEKGIQSCSSGEERSGYRRGRSDRIGIMYSGSVMIFFETKIIFTSTTK